MLILFFGSDGEEHLLFVWILAIDVINLFIDNFYRTEPMASLRYISYLRCITASDVAPSLEIRAFIWSGVGKEILPFTFELYIPP